MLHAYHLNSGRAAVKCKSMRPRVCCQMDGSAGFTMGGNREEKPRARVDGSWMLVSNFRMLVPAQKRMRHGSIRSHFGCSILDGHSPWLRMELPEAATVENASLMTCRDMPRRVPYSRRQARRSGTRRMIRTLCSLSGRASKNDGNVSVATQGAFEGFQRDLQWPSFLPASCLRASFLPILLHDRELGEL